jgi:hypothetical protein
MPTTGCPMWGSPDTGARSPIPTLITLPTLTQVNTATPRLTSTPDKGIFNPENGHWYKLVTGMELSFNYSQLYCSTRGAHLVTISNEAENAFVYDLSPNTLLGATDEAVEGEWVWITGEPWSYTNWDLFVPDNGGCPPCFPGLSPEHYLQFSEHTDGTWNDIPGPPGEFICEWEQ